MFRTLTFLAALSIASPLFADADPAKPADAPKEAGAISDRKPAPHRPWTVDDYLRGENASDLQPSPDGKSLAWVLYSPNDDEDRNIAQLMLSSLEDEFELQLTRGTADCSHPRWSPDGKQIAFLSSRPDPDAKDDGEDPHEQIWVLNVRGGEPRAVTSLARDVVDFGWKDDGTIIYAAPDDATMYEQDLEDKQDESISVEDAVHEPPVRLFSVDVEEGTVTRISQNDDWIETVSISPDGKYALTSHAKSLSFGYDGKTIPETILTDLETLTPKRIYESGRIVLTEAEWDPKSRGFYAAYGYSTDMSQFEATITRLSYFDVKTLAATEVDLGSDRGLSSDPGSYSPTFAIMENGVVALVADGAVNKPMLIRRDGSKWKHSTLKADRPQELFDLRSFPSGEHLMVMRSTPGLPEEWRACEVDGSKLDEADDAVLQAQVSFAEKPMARAELVRWKGALDDEIEGVLHYPSDYVAGKKYPLLVNIHGGPFGADFLCWNSSWYDMTDYYCQRGAFVFNPNYHGSSNYGLPLAESISHGKYYSLPTEDIEKGIAHLVSEGLVDPARVALKGWSNGAILTLALIARSPNYVAASSGAGGAEWTADWGACAFGETFNRFYFGSSPIEDPDLYRRLSPLYDFAKVKTPLIIFHGESDTAVPPHHGWLQYRALQQIAKVPVKLVLFPGEEHSIVKLSHKRRKMEEEIAWFDKYFLQGSMTLPNREFVMAGSPLDAAFRLGNSKSRPNQAHGDTQPGTDTIIPEIAEWDGMGISMFEVTRAQYAAFSPQYPTSAENMNFPATNVTFESARDYCQWLSKLTGRKFRLPNEEEAETLYGAGEGSENTLDYWAGYSVGPDDLAKIRTELGTTIGKSALLRPVGTFSATVDSYDPSKAVFDLGGNAAEWIELEDGKGEARGGSADQPGDTKSKKSLAAPEYIGFRVVEDRG